MGKYHLRGSHVSLIAKTHVRYSIRGGAGLVFVLLSLLTGLIMASVIMDPVSNLKEAAEKQGETGEEAERFIQEFVEESGTKAIKWFTSVDQEQADYLVREKPALVSAFIVMLVFFLPFLISLGAFNQYAGDIANRGMRYQLLRTERANIYIGRFLGTYVFTLLSLGALMAIVAIYLVVKAKFYPAGDLLLWMLQTYLVIAVYALPWVALCGWVSSFIDSAFGSLAISQAIIFVYPLLIYIGGKMKPAVSYGAYAVPWGWKWHLLHPSAGTFLLGVVVMLAFTALFGWLGLRHFARRDL